MPTCSSCGEESPARAKFCLECGAPFAATPDVAEARKVVSMVFCDVEGSTAMAEAIDHEVVNHVLARWVATTREAIERHGGRFVEFRGDSVLGLFGVPVLNEDDAVRAVRAAIDMRAALEELNRDLARDPGIELRVRTGVNTGEVLVGPAAGTGLVVGDPVNLAARLEQAADPGEILIGASTERLVRDQVVLEPMPPLTVKGKADPVSAFRVLRVTSEPGERPRCLTDAAIVGRVDERTRLQLLFDRVRTERVCRGVLVQGEPGLGKTRLMQEFLDGLEGARVARGTCRSYGASALSPLGEALRRLLDLPDAPSAEMARARFGDVLGDEAGHTSAALLQLMDLDDGTAPPEELAAATRRLLAAASRERPVVLSIDDIHWADAILIDLLEHFIRWSREAAIMITATARPEFAETRPSWLSDRTLAITTIELEPLSAIESEVLTERLLGAGRLPPGVRDRIVEAAEGNPLFVEQLLAMLIDDGVLEPDRDGWVTRGPGDGIKVPPTIHALLASRLDRLNVHERAVVERGAVVGRTFYWHAVEALSRPGDRPGVGSHLMTLVRRDLIRPERSDLTGQDAFAFHHVLIRDTTYQAIPKEVRSTLHRAYAGWLETEVGSAEESGSVPIDESIGFHLEQACVLRRELGHRDRETDELASRASSLLAAAGRRAGARGQAGAAVGLLSRALALVDPNTTAQASILVDLAEAEADTGGFAAATAHALEAAAHPFAPADTADRATLIAASLKFQIDPDGVLEETRGTARQLLPEIEDRGDLRTLAMLYRLLSRADLWAGETASMTEMAELSVRFAERSHDARQRAESSVILCWALNLGAAPVAEVESRLRSLADGLREDRRVQAILLAHLAPAIAYQGRAKEAAELLARSTTQFRDLGLEVQAAIATQASGATLFPALAADRAREAIADLRWGYEVLEHADERGFLTSVAGMLAEAELDDGRSDDAEIHAGVCRSLASDDDADAQIRWRMVTAKLRARTGAVAEAVRLSEEVAALPPTYPAWRGFWASDLAEVFGFAGEVERARHYLDEARRAFALKGIVTAEARLARASAPLGPRPADG
jgi:class 3 adenylate cyclase